MPGTARHDEADLGSAVGEEAEPFDPAAAGLTEAAGVAAGVTAGTTAAVATGHRTAAAVVVDAAGVSFAGPDGVVRGCSCCGVSLADGHCWGVGRGLVSEAPSAIGATPTNTPADATSTVKPAASDDANDEADKPDEADRPRRSAPERRPTFDTGTPMLVPLLDKVAAVRSDHL